VYKEGDRSKAESGKFVEETGGSREQAGSNEPEPEPEKLYLVSPWASGGNVNEFFSNRGSEYRDKYALKLVGHPFQSCVAG
jgi:hypothetical protein